MGYSKLTYEQYVDSIDCWSFDPPAHAAELSAAGYHGVSAVDFYDSIFGEDLEEERLPEDYVTGEYGAIAVEKVRQLDDSGSERFVGLRHTITKFNFELYDLIDNSENFCMIAPISYAGRSRKNANARYMYALCIEIDYIKEKSGLKELIYSWQREFRPIPQPTYVVCSGTGLHLYYVFERPIPLWKNIFEQLTEIKKYLTPALWSYFVTSASESIQYESINQPFRCVGSRTKGNSYAMAFEVGSKITIEYLNSFLPDALKLDCVYKSNCTLEQAKELYPDWYKRRIELGQPKGHWNRYKPIYYNWINKILDGVDGAKVGHRYHCLENLCSLAVQCNISPEQVEKDCRRVAERLELLTVDDNNHFTEYDVICALRTYHEASETAYTRRIEYISKKTGITLIPNKRNGRSQEQHVKIMRATRDILYPAGDWNRTGRPKGTNKCEVVHQWRIEHPDGRKVDCERETGLSRHTVLKWWDYVDE